MKPQIVLNVFVQKSRGNYWGWPESREETGKYQKCDIKK